MLQSETKDSTQICGNVARLILEKVRKFKLKISNQSNVFMQGGQFEPISLDWF